jgi:hypothetical protein
MAPLFTGLKLGGFGKNPDIITSGVSLGPTSPTDYPLLSGQYTVFSTSWSGSPSNLPLSDAPTTFTVPSAAQGYVRVVVVGGASGSSYGPGSAGNGAYIDALIPVTPGTRFKAIVGGGGATSSSSGAGGPGCGGGVGVDGNDGGAGGGGSAFFYAEPDATSDPAMFPKGVLIAGGGAGGYSAIPAGSNPAGPSPDPIGGFSGIFRGGSITPDGGEPGIVGGAGGRFRNDGSNFNTPNAARGTGGIVATDTYGGGHGGGGGGGAGAGGGGGIAPPNTTLTPGEPATGDGGRGYGYGSYNTSGAGRGGAYPMRGGNGFRFNGVNLGGGGGGSHGMAHAGGGWGGGGGALYDRNGGSGGSGAWGYVSGIATIQGWTPSSSINVRGGTVNSIMSVPTSFGSSNGNPGYIVVMW